MKSFVYTQLFALLMHLVSSDLMGVNQQSQPPTALQQSQQEISNQLTELSGLLKAELPINTLLVVYQVPVTISIPGEYTVVQDLSYNGTDAAITVASDNVAINFLNHSLTLVNPLATGISAKNVTEFTIKNAIIEGNTSAAAIQLANASNVTLNNVYTENCGEACDIANSQEIQVYASQFTNCGPVHLNDSSHILIDACTFNGSPTAKGLFVEGASEDISITNSNFSNALNAIYVAQVDGLLIDYCQASASASAQNLVQLGSQEAKSTANSVIIRNSTFTQSTPVAGFDGILILAGSGYFLENLVVDTASEDTETNSAAALHIGHQAASPCQNLLANNCIFTGTNPRSVFIENGEKIVLDSCQISGATKYNLQMQNATSCTAKNCMVFNGDSGIYIDNTNGGGTNSVKDCFVFDNTTAGITVNDMAKNNLLGNHVWGSQVGIQIAFSAYTEAFFNTSCNNSQQNCSNVYPSQLPGGTPPGTADIAGANLCCTP